ncbi:protein kinase [Pyxidicoccus parkwayensis]|uniref:Protein kinase n=1 Tax=Pyxidicoccus parkwayensis TaxID=2813578 RepID=A0ABX7NXH1_9BACT|nr:serine/threonine-protein kinase [Pyxidicoccus parkwaysis]QSQ23079.1 protein kinase [Pyxidicoccus parkwaysis]
MRGPLFAAIEQGTDIGGFAVEGLLGQGGCGAVFRARRGGESFALKLQSLSELGGWAQREVSILTRLGHPNVVRFHACGLWPDKAPRWFYIAMELVEGRALNEWVSQENPSARRAVRLVRDLARGLAAAHGSEVLHRDVKESNVVVRDTTGEAVLVDFGVGTYPGAPRLTREVLPPGTQQYRSPEALAFRRAHAGDDAAHYVATAADDLYALGVLFYWVLTDRHPFAAPSTATEVEAVISRPPVAPHVTNPRVPPALGALCMRLLEKRPEARFPSAGALAEALEVELAGADDAWDVPLCESKDSAPAAPQMALDDEEAAWLLGGEGGGGVPRRGRLPQADRMVPDVPGPLASVAVAPSAPSPETSRARSRLTWAVLVGLVVGLIVALAWAFSREQAGPPLAVGREMAPSAPSLESEKAAASPSPTVSTPAVVAPPAAHVQKEESPVKQTVSPAATSEQPRPARRAGALTRVAATAAACTALACPSGPQYRGAPPVEPCPAGAVEAMKKLGVEVGDTDIGLIPLPEPGMPEQPVLVREGWVRIRVGGELKQLNNATVSGRFIVSERVYGRFTEARTKRGENVPVCLEMYDRQESGRGVRREPGNTDVDSARIWSTVELRAVDHFE